MSSPQHLSASAPQHPSSCAPPHVLITGGAGCISSLLTGVLLNQGYHVTIVDDSLFGGEPLLGYWHRWR